VRILVADDERLSRTMLEEALGGLGHDVHCVEDGDAAWACIREQPEIGLVISDWVMPGLSGPELCRQVRRLGRTPYLPIILVTALEADLHLWEGIDAGADAFLSKPVRVEPLRAQLRVVERMRQLEESLRDRVRRLEDANVRIRRDLEAAAAVQRSHLPQLPPWVDGVDFAWAYDACHDIGGDMFNVYRLDESNVAVYVLDVSGHGTPAALLSVSLSRALAPAAQQGGIVKRTLPSSPYYEIVGPAEVVATINQRFQLVEESGHYCTLLYGVLDTESRIFRYACAGHPGPIQILREPAGAVACRSHDSVGGIPIGVLPDSRYEEGRIELRPGNQLLLYTDGVNEARSKSGEEFGSQRLLEALGEAAARCGSGGVEDVVGSLRQRLVEFVEGRAPADDVTIVGIGVR
jgi:sigma-B regulation protein RsbU (phosphoserine phosphatase)